MLIAAFGFSSNLRFRRTVASTKSTCLSSSASCCSQRMRTSTKPPTQLRHFLFLSYRVLQFPESSARTGQTRRHLCLKSERNRRTLRSPVRLRNTPHDCEKHSLGAVRPSVQCGPVCAHHCTFSQYGRFGTPSAPTVCHAPKTGSNSSDHCYTVMRRLTTRTRSEKCVVRRFRRCANVIECTYTNLDSIEFACTKYCRQL